MTGEAELDEHLARWILRALLDCGVARKTIRPSGAVDEDLLRAVGLEAIVDQKLDGTALLRVLKERAATLETVRAPKKGLLFQNARLLEKSLHLTRVERDLLVFAVALQLSPALHDCVEKLKTPSTAELATALGRILRCSAREVLVGLRRDGTLISGGLLQLSEPERHRGAPFRVMDGLALLLLCEHPSAESLVSPFFRKSANAKLSTCDFAHIPQDVALLRGLLQAALERRTRGVNVLLWGPPGTGKTELARLLAREVTSPLFEVCDEDSDGDPMRGMRRFYAYRLCQRVVKEHGRALVLFDEVEDVFDVPSNERRAKAWTNRILEENPVPAFWVTNSVADIDDAFLRRFDFVLELRAPPQRAREEILRARLEKFQPAESWLRRMCADHRLTPAHADRAARVVDLVVAGSPKDGALPADDIASRYFDNAMALYGPRTAPLPDFEGGPRYELSHLNATVDLHQLTFALRRTPKGSILLYGPPGTGKTAFVQRLAVALDRPLHFKRASDLLSCWVGQSEENLARMFRDARREGAVLLLDEADGFLADRRGATKRFELTQVNELLVQMEAFEGLFFCATNLYEALDPASLRRFALKIRFDAPKPEQRFALFVDTLRALGLSLPDEQRPLLRAQLEGLEGLTPGDFRTVIRHSRLLQSARSAGDVVVALAAELRARPEHRRSHVGFAPARGGAAAQEQRPPAYASGRSDP